MTTPKRRPGTRPAGSDVDLDRDEIYLGDGSRLTEEVASQFAERALLRRRGRPSVTGQPRRTPSLTLRVPSQTRLGLEAIAAAQGRHLSDVGRDALDEYIQRHAS